MSDNKRLAGWLEQRLPVWREVSEQLEGVEQGRAAPAESLRAVVRAYPEIARDIAIARRHAPNGPLTRYLEGVYLQLHRSLFKAPVNVTRVLRDLLVKDAAAIAYGLRWQIAWVSGLFVLSGVAGAWLIYTYPHLAALFVSDAVIEGVARGELWTDNLLNVLPPGLLAITIFTNNIVVCLMAVCLGILYGLGTGYIIILNGAMMGAIFAFTAQHGLAGRLFEFVAAHGFVELSVVCIAGAVGVSLGEAIARPGHSTRAAAFQEAAARGAKLMLVCLLFLVGAGLLEGFVSPHPGYPFWMKVAVGVAYLALLLGVLSGVLARVRRKIV